MVIQEGCMSKSLNTISSYVSFSELLTACKKGDLFTVARLLNQGVCPTHPHADRNDGSSCLDATLIHCESDETAIDIIKLLVEHGANPHLNDMHGSLLHRAVAKRREPLIKFLVDELKINIHAVNGDEESALHVAARWHCPSIVKFLLERGANPTLLTRQGHSPKSLALSSHPRIMHHHLLSRDHLHFLKLKIEQNMVSIKLLEQAETEWLHQVPYGLQPGQENPTHLRMEPTPPPYTSIIGQTLFASKADLQEIYRGIEGKFITVKC